MAMTDHGPACEKRQCVCVCVRETAHQSSYKECVAHSFSLCLSFFLSPLQVFAMALMGKATETGEASRLSAAVICKHQKLPLGL